MQLVIYTIIFFIIIGGIGMYFGSRKVDRAVARQRWLKYGVYIVLTSFVVCSIWFHFFPLVVLLIILAGYFELARTVHSTRYFWIALLVYSVIVAGFVFYAIGFQREFQFFIYLQVLSLDAFSQVVGQLVGKKAIAPQISPSKTREGLLGGIVFSVLAALLTSNWMQIPALSAVAFGLFTAITGFAGDLLASFYKRIAGIKDYSNLLPEQGGFLDRFDSFMMAAFFYSLARLFMPHLLPYD
jgi:phosphatidate cytidylyltransferase